MIIRILASSLNWSLELGDDNPAGRGSRVAGAGSESEGQDQQTHVHEVDGPTEGFGAIGSRTSSR